MVSRRLIEVDFPIRGVGKESEREKHINRGHISALHIWWARRPLASSRATNYSALIQSPTDAKELEEKKRFIVELSKWENSLNEKIIDRAMRDILEFNGGKPPKILDPFAGGGSIPLEAMRLGCESYAGDYNPVAVFILKCTLEYPQKYGREGEVEREFEEFGERTTRRIRVKNVLVEDIKYWSDWVYEEVKREVGKFYPNDKDGAIPIGFIWARTIRCQNPLCGAEIPLMKQYWLAKRQNRKVSLYPYIEGKEVKFKVVGTGYEEMPEGFNPEEGTVSKAKVRCPVCGAQIDGEVTKKLFQRGESGQRMVAVVSTYKERGKKIYRLANEEDIKVYEESEKYLKKKEEELRIKWGMEPVPDEPLPPKDTIGFGAQRYGMLKWGDIFNPRQKLILITFTDKIREAYEEMIKKGYDKEYAKVVTSYLVLGLGRLVDYSSTLTIWENNKDAIAHTYSRQALPMVWDYAESNPLGISSGNWNSGIGWILDSLVHLSKVKRNFDADINNVVCFSATSIPYPDNFFDAVFTDPPYYDNVAYSYLSDLFYVWFKRSIGHLYPELFSDFLTPKNQEIVAYSHNEGGIEAGKKFFEENLKKAFQEIHRVLKPDGIVVIVYAHKSDSGWETLMNSIFDSGLVVTASWPIETEMRTRLIAKRFAVLSHSVHLVARKQKRVGIGRYEEVIEEIKDYLTKKMGKLWMEGVSGLDLYNAGIGLAIEVFSKYDEVIDLEGNRIRADKLLVDFKKIVTDYFVNEILQEAQSIDAVTKFYVACRWKFGESKIKLDKAKEIALEFNLNLEDDLGIIKSDKDYIKLLGPQDRDVDDLKRCNYTIDVLHFVAKLFDGSNYKLAFEKIKQVSRLDDILFKIAQAISFSLSDNSKEKKLMDIILLNRNQFLN